MNYFTSDLHFGCDAIRIRCNRPWKDVKSMNEDIISRFNDVLKSDDTLFILGDVACAEYDPTSELTRIHGKKILISGNHDARWLHHRHFRKCFEKIEDIMPIREEGTRIVLCHYPLAEWDGYWKGHWHFYGHVHNSNEGAGLLMKQIPRAVNVGVDVNEFMPKTAKELMLIN